MARKWIQRARRRMERKGTVGAFTRQAKRAGFKSPMAYARHVLKSPMAYARHVLAHKGRYSTKTVRRAVFALNAGRASKRRSRRK